MTIHQKQNDDHLNKVIKFKCHVTILRGRQLAPKDRILGIIKATSDPYVEVWANGKLHGKTPVKQFTLNPVWDRQNEYTIDMEEGYYLPPPKLEFKIWDEDTGRDPDAMGTVTMIAPARNDDTTEWYQIPKHSATNAKGELQVRIQTQRIRKTKKNGGKASKSPVG
jgi:Ca2+-dependent lipid-binding protein